MTGPLCQAWCQQPATFAQHPCRHRSCWVIIDSRCFILEAGVAMVRPVG